MVLVLGFYIAHFARSAPFTTSPNEDGARSGTGNREFRQFVYSVMIRAQPKISALLVALAYLDRAKLLLDPRSFGTRRIQERVFIAALALATKVRRYCA